MSNHLGLHLLLLRRMAGLTQVEVAEVVGVGQPAISKLERGSVQPSVAQIEALAGLYGLSPQAIMRRGRRS